MAIIEFSRKNQATQEVINFKCCVSLLPSAVNITPKERYDGALGNWLLVTVKGCHIMYILGDSGQNASGVKNAWLKYEIASLVPDMSDYTLNGRTQGVQTWNHQGMMNFFETQSINEIGRAKRQINGLLEKVFYAVPIFDPMGDQSIVVSESEMYPRVVAFQTQIALS